MKFDQFQTSSKKLQQVATTRNNTQHGVQTLATCWTQQCCVLLANNVASVCTGLYFGIQRGRGEVRARQVYLNVHSVTGNVVDTE